ncbi:hypothetical protein H5410_060538 [Solanum commersonii]|uniref:Uncharacterized protein n=1 Tax=Solanum commersonii TaxID=4109 RepID=A0A9J5W6B4_SOLCO|nr:hypothetical protein H5410_060538 [Solanum commersonii]
MWPKSDRPTIEPPEITAIPGRLGKNKRKDSDEPVKKKFGKAIRKGRKMKCSVCKTFGHNKKGCPTLKNVAAGQVLQLQMLSELRFKDRLYLPLCTISIRSNPVVFDVTDTAEPHTGLTYHDLISMYRYRFIPVYSCSD